MLVFKPLFTFFKADCSITIKTLWPSCTATFSKDWWIGAYSIGQNILGKLNCPNKKIFFPIHLSTKCLPAKWFLTKRRETGGFLPIAILHFDFWPIVTAAFIIRYYWTSSSLQQIVLLQLKTECDANNVFRDQSYKTLFTLFVN
jgi:hypothetical protein